MEIFLVFIIGISVGSFLNVLIDRLPREESIVKGRSYCESCKKVLKWYDLIPVFSFIWLRGKCRYCGSPISFYYPIVELATGIMFVTGLVFSGLWINGLTNYELTNFIRFFYYVFIFSSLIVIFFTDLKYGVIPDRVTTSAIIVSILYIILNTNYLIPSLVSAVGSFVFLLLIFLATRGRGMGFGDVKLAFWMGLLLGFPKIVAAFYIAFLTGAIVSIILILLRKKKFKGSTIPFGPFLVIGTTAAMFWGDMIWQKFFNL